MNELLDTLNTAVQTQNWVLLALVAVLIVGGIVSVILKAMGKSVPIVDTLLELGKSLIKVVPAKKAPEPKPGEPSGIAAVVKIDDKREQ